MGFIMSHLSISYITTLLQHNNVLAITIITIVPVCTYAAMWNCVKEGDLDRMSQITEWFPSNLVTVE
jgi:hypothetical protein